VRDPCVVRRCTKSGEKYECNSETQSGRCFLGTGVGDRLRRHGGTEGGSGAVERSPAARQSRTSTKALQWTVTYADLSSPISAAHFHGPAPVGQNAKIQIPIDKSALASPIKGSATLTDQQVTDLMAGQWYFNIHTAQNPMGEIRGQVRPSN
jgi:hypothetical protein